MTSDFIMFCVSLLGMVMGVDIVATEVWGNIVCPLAALEKASGFVQDY